jgi:glutamate dehydrogenase/leucine dehydrogenase
VVPVTEAASAQTQQASAPDLPDILPQAAGVTISEKRIAENKAFKARRFGLKKDQVTQNSFIGM